MEKERNYRWVFDLLLLLAFLYLFFVSVELIGEGFKFLGKGFARSLFRVTSNPLVGLVIGILATSIVQSSSTTTSTVVGMVAGGVLNIRHAIPIIMGANIGTTITNTIVSLAHITRREEFRKAFAGATMHDFFNLLSVSVLLPLEVIFHPLEKGAILLTEGFKGIGGMKAISPLKAIVKPAVELLMEAFKALHLSKGLTFVLVEVFALAALIISLKFMVDILKGIFLQKIEGFFDAYIFRNTGLALFWGFFITAIVQSSSMTTSLLIPLIAGGIVTLEAAFPFTLGANIGTTFTAIMASFATHNPAAITVAFTHLLFNLSGTAIFLPLKRLPIGMARLLAEVAHKNRWVALVYVLVVFFLIPLGIIFL